MFIVRGGVGSVQGAFESIVDSDVLTEAAVTGSLHPSLKSQ